MDFVLWKPSDADLPGWDSPWGRGRPGWHIECSAMSHELLGDSFDIHGGGIDLQFPHHENEIAQSKCAHPEADFARVWMHNEMLQVEGKKMSKSLGNFFTVRDLLDKGIPGEVIRFVFLSTHYSKPMDWTEEKARQAKVALWKWEMHLTGIQASTPHPRVLSALSDDLNTSTAIAELHVLFARWDALQRGLVPGLEEYNGSREEQLVAVEGAFLASAQLLGLLQHAYSRVPESFVETLLIVRSKLNKTRELAHRSKDFAKIDALKRALADAGVQVRMNKTEIELVPGPDFDPAKLEALK